MTTPAQLALSLFVAIAPMQPRMTLLDRAKEGGLVGMVGLGAMVIAIILGLYWLICVCISRRPGSMPLIMATILALAGYLAFEKDLVATNLAMRDVQTIREDCRRLMDKVHETSEKSSEAIPLQLTTYELPPSLSKLGAKSAIVTDANVEILLQNDIERGASGILYAPQETQGIQPWLELRPLWYRDFYAFQKWSE